MRAVDRHTGGHARDDMALLLLENGASVRSSANGTQPPSLLPRPEHTSLTVAAASRSGHRTRASQRGGSAPKDLRSPRQLRRL
jgi:hypothetical protein